MSAGRFFLRYVGWRKGLGAALLACAALVAGAELAIPWLLQHAVDAALGDGSGPGLDRLALAMLGVIGILYVAHVALLRVEARMLAEASFRLRQRLYTHFHRQPLAFFHRHKAGELLHRKEQGDGGSQTRQPTDRACQDPSTQEPQTRAA